MGTVDSSLQGQRGDILLDKNGQFITLLTNNTDSVTTTITRVQGNYLHTANGSRYTFADDTPVYTGTNGQVSTYKEMLPSLLPGQAVTIYLDDGQVVGMFCARTATAVSYTHLDVYKRQLSFYGSADRFALVGDCRKSATVEQAMRSAYACLLYTSRCV